MKLVGELKKEVEKIETKEGKKEVIKKAGMELSDEELDQVAGGKLFKPCWKRGSKPCLEIEK